MGSIINKANKIADSGLKKINKGNKSVKVDLSKPIDMSKYIGPNAQKVNPIKKKLSPKTRQLSLLRKIGPKPEPTLKSTTDKLVSGIQKTKLSPKTEKITKAADTVVNVGAAVGGTALGVKAGKDILKKVRSNPSYQKFMGTDKKTNNESFV